MPHCPRCSSTATATVPGPHPGGHHARLECGDCGRFLKWLPRPAGPTSGPSAEVLAMAHDRRLPAALEGTDPQRRFARKVRYSMLLRLAGRDDLVALVRCVVDASWFLANRDRDVAAIRWPEPWQMESPAPMGPCPNCGDPSYGAVVCSEECSDEFVAHLIAAAPERS